MQYFIGVDGGGTKSRLIIGDIMGKKLFISQGDSINIFSVGIEKSFKSLKNLIDSALIKHQIPLSDIERICIASAGLARPYELNKFNNFFLKTYPGTQTILITDIMALLVGALGSEDGICLISGTGSVAMGRDNNQIIRSGGFGWKLGDEGSASNIALEAVKRIIRSSENRDLKTLMTKPILNHFGLKKIEDTIKFFHDPKLDKSTVASAAYIVTEFARKGDLLALDILEIGASELFNLVLSVQSRLASRSNRTLVTAGGVFEHDEVLSDFFKREVQKYNLNSGKEFGNINQSPCKGNALDGALNIAIKGI